MPGVAGDSLLTFAWQLIKAETPPNLKKVRDWQACLPIQEDYKRRPKPGILVVTIVLYPADFPDVCSKLRDIFSQIEALKHQKKGRELHICCRFIKPARFLFIPFRNSQPVFFSE